MAWPHLQFLVKRFLGTREAKGLPDRSWPEEQNLRVAVENEHGQLLAALASIRDRAYSEIENAGITVEQLYGNERAFVLPIYLRSISYLDCIRILCERGYGEEAFGLVRSLYEAEIDSYLLFAGEKPEILQRYSDFELYERALTAARGLETNRLPNTEEIASAVARRIAEMKKLLERRGKTPPDDFEELSLMKAARRYAKLLYGDSRPLNWREGMSWRHDVIPMISRAEISLMSPGIEDEDPGGFEKSLADRETEHEIAYPLMSAEIHGSPATVAARLEVFRVAGDPNEISKTAPVAASHFFRVSVLVRELFEIDGDDKAWVTDLRAAGLDL